MKTSSMGYVTITRLDHYNEKGVPTGKVRDKEAEFIMLDCKHGMHRVWVTRQNIK